MRFSHRFPIGLEDKRSVVGQFWAKLKKAFIIKMWPTFPRQYFKFFLSTHFYHIFYFLFSIFICFLLYWESVLFFFIFYITFLQHLLLIFSLHNTNRSALWFSSVSSDLLMQRNFLKVKRRMNPDELVFTRNTTDLYFDTHWCNEKPAWPNCYDTFLHKMEIIITKFKQYFLSIKIRNLEINFIL